MDLIGKIIYTYSSQSWGYQIKIREVISAANYGTEENPQWYIEGYGDITSRGHTDENEYFYWKQPIDGGKLFDPPTETDWD